MVAPGTESNAPKTDSAADDDDDGSGVSSRLRDLGGYIRNQRKGAELSLRNLAKIAGVSNPYLSQIERGLRKPSAEILQAIAKALHISSETLYVKAGILEERSDDGDLESAIARDHYLTEPQRRALIEMYRSFRRLAELQDTARGDAEDHTRIGPRKAIRGLIDAVTTGDVDDADLARTTPDEETPDAV